MSSKLTPLLLLLAACGECTCFAGHAAVTHEENGRTVVVDAQGFRDFDVGAWGAPHAFGILYPEFRGAGYRVTMQVDDRAVVDVARSSTEHAPSSSMLEEVLDAITVRVSNEAEHVALRFEERWHVFHLLDAGPPFELPDSVVEAETIDLASLPSAEEMGVAFLADESAAHDEHTLFWEALDATEGGPPWDDAVLGPWPRSERAHAYVIARLGAPTAPSDAWRAALEAEARRVVDDGVVEEGAEEGEDDRERAVAAFVALGGESLAWLDAHAIATWGDVAASSARRLDARSYLKRRVHEVGLRWLGDEVLPEELNEPLTAASRRVIDASVPSARPDERYERRPGIWVVGATSNEEIIARNSDLRFAFETIEARGAEADRDWEQELVLAAWPTTDWNAFDDAVERRIAGDRSDVGLRGAVSERAARAFRDDADVSGVARVLFLFQQAETDDQARRGLLAHFDQSHWHVLREHLDGATPAFERAAAEEARRIIRGYQAAPVELEAERERVGSAIELVFRLDAADCTELRELGELSRTLRPSAYVGLPDRCAPTPPTPTPTPTP